MLGNVTTHLCVTHCPNCIKLSLLRPVLNPLKPHVHDLGTLLLDCLVDDAIGCGVLCLNVCCQPWTAHICECCTDESARFGVNKNSTTLGISNGGDHILGNIVEQNRRGAFVSGGELLILLIPR
jgi:hypothetical protein